jgi:hypothetical protein
LIRDKKQRFFFPATEDGAALLVSCETRQSELRDFVIGVFDCGISVILADAECLVAREYDGSDCINREGFDLFSTTPFAKRTHLDSPEGACAVIDQSILMQVPLCRREPIGAADYREHGAVGGACVRCDPHHIARALAFKNRNATAIDRPHVGQRKNSQAMRKPLGDDRDVDFSTAEHDVIGHIDIIGPKQPAHCQILPDLAVETEDEQRAVGVFVGSQNQTFRGIFAIDPDGRVVGVVANFFGGDFRLQNGGRGCCRGCQRRHAECCQDQTFARNDRQCSKCLHFLMLARERKNSPPKNNKSATKT